MKRGVLVVVCLVAYAELGWAGPTVEYAREVKPILTAHCTSCHGAIRQKSGLRLDAADLIRRGGSGGPAIESGKSDESLLIERVTAHDASERMPPESEGLALSSREIAVLRAWIDQGAHAPAETIPEDPRGHWAYQVPRRPAIPAAEPAWSRNPIDAFLAAGHRAKGLRPSPPVSNDLWLRRVTIDLIGLPPTRDELNAFRADMTAGARSKVVDRLLASPRYGERWARHWMDVWRYSDWYGLGDEPRYSHPHIWHWRDWIIESLNADKGYDRMVAEMLAGDELAPDEPATLRATGFLVRNWDIFNRDAWLANTVEHTARAFLGVTIQCARCHDHKFDPISQVDYYRLRAFFEPYHIRIDRVPGQPDRAKAGLPRVFDEFVDRPTYRYVRGDENRPDETRPLSPATPAVLGGPEIRVDRVSLPLTAYRPDASAFVIREALEEAAAAVVKARSASKQASGAFERAARDLAAAIEAEHQAQAKAAPEAPTPEARKMVNDAAAQAVERLAKARRGARDAEDDHNQADSALAVAEARRASLVAVVAVERIEDESGNAPKSAAWVEAAQDAANAQRRQAVVEANHDRLAAQIAAFRAQRAVNGLIEVPDDPKAPAANSARTKAATELVEARRRLAEAATKLTKAESEAKALVTTAYTPRPRTFHRAKTTYRDTPPNTPYPRFSTGRRLALARWITDRTNPLSARVAVNHVWARHFGEPLVTSMFDFGLRTDRPVNHDLLDWLAVELMESGWSLKHLHRLIVTSEAYRMRSSGVSEGSPNARIDPDNHYVWRMNVRRMEAEVVRDSLLYVAGKLDPTMGGPDLPVAAADKGARRTIYYHYSNLDHIPFLTMFDAASVTECYRRDETIVPQQALALSNSAIALSRAAELSEAIDREVGNADTPNQRAAFVTAAFERVLGRAPSEAEQRECEQALDQLKAAAVADTPTARDPHLRARADLVHVLLNHNDFVSIR